jgi:hypothetical protein
MLWQRGYGFDYISDRQIRELQLSGSELTAPGGTYRAIVVPPCTFMPLETLETLMRLQAQGGSVLFADPLPADVPGLADLDSRHARFRELIATAESCHDLAEALGRTGVTREAMTDAPGVLCIRRRHESGHYYFIANQGSEAVDEWVTPAVGFNAVVIMDPMTGRVGIAQTRGAEQAEVRLQLDSGAALFLKTSNGVFAGTDEWEYTEAGDEVFRLEGRWEIDFIEGGPELPHAYETKVLGSWTEQGGATERFAGTAVYRLYFDAPCEGDTWLLDLGEVHASARVRLNGVDIATLIGPTYRTRVRGVRATGNELEVEVTNLAANRIRDLDRRGVEWRIFDDINFVTREYERFDARDWPVMASGLLGPVTLLRLQK